MIDGLKPYATYKDSGLRWIGEIPSHWDLQHAKWLFRRMDRPVRDSDEVVTCFRDGTVTLRKNRRLRGFTESLKEIGYQGIRRGDLVIHAMDAFAGAVGVSDSDGKGTPVYSVCEPASNANASYYAHLIGEMARSQWILALATGIRERSTDFRFEGFASQLVPIPPLVEQNAIVRFLDHAERQIRRYIHAKKKLIALLNEQKQTVIEGAVTRGLDPTVSLKLSGVAWLGDVPAHWVVASLRFRYHQCLGKMVDTKRATGTRLLPYLRNVDVQWDRINAVNLPQIDITAEEHERYTVRVGDLLVCEGRHLGRAAFWRGELPTCAFQKALHRLRPRDPANDSSRYLFYCLYVVHFKDAFGASSDDNSIPHLTGEMLRAHKFPFPPFDEQGSIALYLDERVSSLNRARAAVESEIECVHQYRARLIADVVTGKVDVRQAASELPDASTMLENEAFPTTDADESESVGLGEGDDVVREPGRQDEETLA